jgi:hypothetical protein
MHGVKRFCLLALLASAACAKKPSIVLQAKLPATFAQVSNVVELADGRVAFADTRDRLFLTGDLKSGKVDTIGARVDSMPRDAAASVYKFPGWVAHLGGDTLVLVDFAAVRTTLWNEHGQPLASLVIPPVGGETPVLSYDRSGFGYKTDYQAILGGGEPGRSLRPDSVAVLRIQLASGRTDTVANLAAPEFGDAKFGEQGEQVAKIFSPNDLFGVLPDGRVWVARGRENRVDWRGPGGIWIRGKSHNYDKLPVTDADKAKVIARIREHGKGRGLPDSIHLEWPFADHKPPFESAMGSPAGEVWLQRPQPADAKDLIYDVFGPDGGWKRAVVFPAGVTLAGFGGGGAIYGSIKEGDRKTVGRFKEQ